jgi:hypothetical protein
MEKIKAEILSTGNPHIKAARLLINAPAAAIFDLLANPFRHADFDGSGTLQGKVAGPARLFLNARFGMNMKLGVKYRILNRVVEFEEDKLIAWRHFGRHRWRYQLRQVAPNQTEVTETFDGTYAILPRALWLINAYRNNQIAVAKTLVKLKKIVETNPT